MENVLEKTKGIRKRENFYFKRKISMMPEKVAGNTYAEVNPYQMIELCSCGYKRIVIDRTNVGYLEDDKITYERNGISDRCPDCNAAEKLEQDAIVLTGLYFEENNGLISLAYHGYRFVAMGVGKYQHNKRPFRIGETEVESCFVAAMKFNWRITVDPVKKEVYILDRNRSKIKVRKAGFNDMYPDLWVLSHLFRMPDSKLVSFFKRSLEAVGVHEKVIQQRITSCLEWGHASVLFKSLIMYVKYPALAEINAIIGIQMNLSEDERKSLRKATTRKEAFQALIPAISKKGMAKMEKLAAEGIYGHLMFKLFSDSSYLNEYLEHKENSDSPIRYGGYESDTIILTGGKIELFEHGKVVKVDLFTNHSIKEFRKAFFKDPKSLDRALIRYDKKVGDDPFQMGLDAIIRDSFRLWTIIRRSLRQEKGETAKFMKNDFFNKKHDLKEIHDFLSAEQGKIQEKEVDFTYQQAEVERFNWVDPSGKYRFELPKSNHTLQDVGGSMNICVSGYSGYVYAKTMNIVNVYENKTDKPVYCLEIRDSSIRQAKLSYNRILNDVNDELMGAMKAYMLKANLEADSRDLIAFLEPAEQEKYNYYAAS